MPLPFDLALNLTPTEDERISQAQALVTGFCGWHVAPVVTETVVLNGWGRSALTLPSLNVISVNSILSDGTALTVDDYDWAPEGVIYRRGYRWDGRAITVSFTHGYEDAPEVIAIIQAVAKRAIQNPGSSTRRQVGPFLDQYSLTATGESAAMALLESEKAVLGRYRIPVSG